jgi:hypothetical protein
MFQWEVVNLCYFFDHFDLLTSGKRLTNIQPSSGKDGEDDNSPLQEFSWLSRFDPQLLLGV